MPWSIKERDGRFCVVKDSDNSVEKCHGTRQEALAHQRALYANEPGMTAAVAPLKPPRTSFFRPESSEPTPLTITAAGEVYGHLALWETCHSGFLNGRFSECVKAPRSRTDYSFFHLGQIETEEGDFVSIGKLTFDTSHAPLTADLQAASRHYDQTGAVGAFVRASDGRHGPWLSGVPRSDLSPEGLRDLRANPPSGDWRALNHNLELIAALAVPVPGFPIPRSQLALAASAEGGMEVSAQILPGPTPDDLLEQMTAAEFVRERNEIRAELDAILASSDSAPSSAR
jgi:hypothetical protein